MTGKFFQPTPDELHSRHIREERQGGKQDTSLTERGYVYSRRDGPPISFLGHKVGLDKMGHTAVIGASGAGKNLSMGPTFRSIAEAVHRDPTRRMLIIETKEDAVSWLKGMGIPYELITFTYREGKAWNIGRDFGSNHLIAQLNYSLFPEMDGNNAFFRNAGRALNIAGTSSIHKVTNGEWGIDDLVNLGFSDLETMKSVLGKSELGQRVLNTFFDSGEDEESLYKVRTEVASRLWPMLVPAAKYQVSESLSLTDFWAGRTKARILVVKVNPEKHDIERPIVQALLQRSLEIVMSYPDTLRKDKIIWVDDFNFYRGIPKFIEASEIVRAKGGLLITLFQSIEALRAKDSYGDKADAVLANFRWKVFLGTSSAVTAQWNASLFGRSVVREADLGSNYGKGGATSRMGERRTVENIVQDGKFLDMEPPSPSRGVTCYVHTPLWGPEVEKRIPWQQIIERHPLKGPVSFTALAHDLEIPALWDADRLHLMTTGEPKEKEPKSSDSTVEPSSFDAHMQSVDEEIRRIVFDLTLEAIRQIFPNLFDD
ncbi:type IV secretion system DNA-binding domain-containing protein [Nodosilinea sp. LEGE 07298]|uniref:type IV secretory system conjugative DNA transfer family protein n=1 Tax=Nodosilinea sp. LEGE 07298 TaxID=2777970 RepID=UPI001880005E|nr:type IV secretion system DNA-binding domain-containing protein [Nodosilinea sp. LEGE 07298]MBE9108244.1 type IV secretion system DNA-binding domain-containing protein [Nodosilinea sp. LEGE 07298]